MSPIQPDILEQIQARLALPFRTVDTGNGVQQNATDMALFRAAAAEITRLRALTPQQGKQQ
jgi:hypothetical protein